MEEFDFELKRALSGTDPMPEAKLKKLRDDLVVVYGDKQRKVKRILYGWMAGFMIMIAWLFYMFQSTNNLKQCLLYAVLMLVAYEGTVLTKLWYWSAHFNIATLREIKQVQLQLAEAAARQADKPGNG